MEKNTQKIMYNIRHIEKRAYSNWISTEVPDKEKLGECTTWSRAMNAVFPELIHVGGYVFGASFFDSSPRSHYHEYLVDPVDGSIVDPTAKQFDMMFGAGDWEYQRWEEELVI